MMDVLSEGWLRLAGIFGRRPVQLLMLTLGVIVVTATLGYSLATSEQNSADIERIKQEFCVPLTGTDDNEEQCRRLMNELLKNPTPEQARRLRQIVESAR